MHLHLDQPGKNLVPTAATALMFCGVLISTSARATSNYLNAVNSYCGTSYACTLCHTTPPGLNDTGSAFNASGHDPSTICPSPSAPSTLMTQIPA